MNRILVSGSRDWTDRQFVWNALDSAACLLAPDAERPLSVVSVVHGACPTGADKHADDFCKRFVVAVERHPADWETHGRRAGYLRNQEMVDAGADIVLVFNKNSSRGASMTARLAREAGLPVIEYKVEE